MHADRLIVILRAATQCVYSDACDDDDDVEDDVNWDWTARMHRRTRKVSRARSRERPLNMYNYYITAVCACVRACVARMWLRAKYVCCNVIKSSSRARCTRVCLCVQNMIDIEARASVSI